MAFGASTPDRTFPQISRIPYEAIVRVNHGICSGIAFVTNDAALTAAINIPYESHFRINNGDLSMAREASRSCNLGWRHVAESLEARGALFQNGLGVNLLSARAALQDIIRFEG